MKMKQRSQMKKKSRSACGADGDDCFSDFASLDFCMRRTSCTASFNYYE
jgi:hypothetical protein